jgi:hypothetical protein
MTTVDELFDRYRSAYQAGEDADPRKYLSQLSGTDRRELAALIDGFLMRAPAPAPAEQARASPITERAVANLMAERRSPETWQTLLPAAEARAGLARDQLVARLAEDLGVADKRDKVHLRYHQMERGLLDPARVRAKVLEALGRILDVSVDRLRAAGERLSPPPAPGKAAVFARATKVTPLAAASIPPPAQRPEEPWDEVDDLFQGG